ncbi:MAG TPA: LacI family DNA-binding transcriptional regulator [Ignavibacteriaceae bacterium]|mgnify:FL=1|nr:LacI family DNA-binding transcriptional regulator [Ignavibacterium sp.]HMN25574.1 LacI family DNA-binding transcriptional regulator [Ignavibacteriaceae bacterium]
MTPTIKQIAKKANVSIATVSRALNDDVRVTDETKAKVLRISNELNYKPNLVARNFVKRTSYAIGLILPDISDEFFTDIIRGVDEITYKNGYYTMVASSHKHRTLADSITTFSHTGLVGGVILLMSTMTDDLINILNHTTIPVVIIGGGKQKHDFDTVSIDNYQGAFNATEYLIKKKKFKKIAHITGPAENYDAFLRKKGFTDACKKNGISINKSFIIDGNYTIDSGYHAFIQLYGLPEKPEAIFAANDMMALGCYDAANYFNVKIPDDIGLVGFDDIFMSKYINPSLTTVRVQIEEVGKVAAKLLIERLNNSNGKSHSSIKIPTELIIRNSC